MGRALYATLSETCASSWGRSPHDRTLQALIAELATQSDGFAAIWAAHDVRYHDSGTKTLHNPVVGDRDLSFGVLDLPVDLG